MSLDPKEVDYLLWARNVTQAILCIRKGIPVRPLLRNRTVGPLFDHEVEAFGYWLIHTDAVPVGVDLTSYIALAAMAPIADDRARTGALEATITLRKQFEEQLGEQEAAERIAQKWGADQDGPA